jgi:hypothetical protein
MLTPVQKAVALAGLLAVSGFVMGASAQAELAGTWKLNPEKSRLPSEWLRFAPADNGAIRYTEGATTYTFKTDGTPVPRSFHTYIKLDLRYTKDSESHYTERQFLQGKVISTATYEISPDNRTLTLDMVINGKDGSTTHAWTRSYERMGTGQGLLGDWRSDAVDGYRITNNGDGSITFEYIVWKDPAKPDLTVWWQVLLRADGSYAAPTGPNAMARVTMAMVPTKDGSYQMLKQIDGKPAGQSLFTLSFDGKSMTESTGVGKTMNESLRADDPDAEVAFYDKQ